MKVDYPTPDSTLGTVLQGAAAMPRRSLKDDPFEASKEYGFWDAFGAAFFRENELIAAYNRFVGGDGAAYRKGKTDHNPYRYLSESYDKETLDKLLPFIDDGEFEESPSAETTRAIAEDILWEVSLLDRMEGSFAGTLAGSAVTSLFSPTTYLPFIGGAAAAGKIGRGGMVALNTALAAGVSEAALQATQRARSIEESILNIGTAGVIGGGLGIFAGALSKKSVLHPSHPDNPLRKENLRKQGEQVRSYGGEKDDIRPDEIDELQSDVVGGGSLGAAALRDDAPLDNSIARGDPKSWLGRAVRKSGDFFNSRTIVGRVVRAASPTARALGLSLMDPGAILLKQYLRGKGAKRSAEILKSLYMTEVDGLFATHLTNTTKLNQDLGKRAWSRGKVDHADVMKLTQRVLFKMEDPDLEATLKQKYGEKAMPLLRQTAEHNAEEIHKLNGIWEERLIKEGLLQDVTRVSELQSRLTALRDQIEAATSKETPAEGAAVSLADLRKQRDAVVAELSAEARKAKPLGREYGHAQLYKREAILENPDEFRAFLMDALSFKPQEDWLVENYHLTESSFEELKADDPAKYREILADWAGDEHYYRIDRIEKALTAAQEELKQSKLDLQESLRAAGEARRDEAAVTISAARKKRDALMTRLETSRARARELKATYRALTEAATAARGKSLDRLMQEGRTAPEQRQDALTEGRNLKTAIEQQLEVVEKVDAKVREGEGVELSPETLRQEGRAKEAAAELARAEADLKVLEERAARLDEKLRRAEDAEREAKLIRQQLDDEVVAARRARNISETTVSKVKRALRKENKKTPLNEAVDDIVRTIIRGDNITSAIMDRIAEESDMVSGRVKERVIHFTPEARMEGVAKGFLDDDLSKILFLQYRQLAAEVALREGVGYGNVAGRQFKSWSEALDFVDEEYEQMIAQTADRKLKDRIKKEARILRDDLIEARRRLKGVYDDDGTTDGWLKWGSEKLRQVNYARYGGMFLLSSVTDTATVALRHGGLIKLLRAHGKAAIEDMRRAWAEAPTEMQAFAASIEYGMGAAAAARRYGSDDLIHGRYANYGIGTGNQRRFTGAIDKGLEKVTHTVAVFSGLPTWNRFWKTVSGIAMSNKLGRMLTKYDTLSQAEIADLASLGIGRAEATRLAKHLKEHGKTDANGRYDPHLERWGDSDEAVEAARDFRIAILRDMERAINTPGIGDTPRLMTKWWGRTWLQFQTFAFTFMSRYAYPAVQRAALFKERQALASLAILFTAATFSMFFRDIRNGRDPSERLKKENLEMTLREIVDLSGMTGWTSPYVDSALKLTAPITGYGATNRYARNTPFESLSGVSGNLFGDFQRAASAAASADPDVVDKWMNLAPFATHYRLLNNLTKD
jgi:hypothetical protein